MAVRKLDFLGDNQDLRRELVEVEHFYIMLSIFRLFK